MNDTIKVGDRVRGKATGRKYLVLAIYEDMAWILHEETDLTSSVGFQYLTRIEPEKVALTVGQKVRLSVGSSEGRVGIIKDLREEAYVEIDDSRETTVHWPPLRIWKLSSELEPVPAPCPTCKGGGKASE